MRQRIITFQFRLTCHTLVLSYNLVDPEMLLGVLLLCLGTYSTIAGPIGPRAERSGESKLVNGSVQSASSTNLSWLPPAPPGFDTQVLFDTTKSDPRDVYQAIIKALCILAVQPWDGRLSSGGLVVNIGEASLVAHTVDPITGHVSHAIRAIVELLTDMRDGTPGFFYGGCRVLIRGEVVALVGIAPLSKPQGSAITSDQSTGRTLDAAGTWNTIAKPELLRPGYKIIWRYNGRSIPAQEILSLFVDAVSTVAQHDTWSNCEYVDAIGPARGATFHMNTLGPGGLRWFDVSGTIEALVAQAIFPSKRFAEMEWELWLGGTKRAHGDVLKLNAASVATSTS
ncbi:MAG: hypothetical protein Q9218_000178 [Villophora microphyllina]